MYDVEATEAYIRRSAIERGIDPDIAVRVARSEGLARGVYQSKLSKNGFREPSFGPFQLLVGGEGTPYPAGMGNDFMAQTGLDPRDPSTVPQQVDFALDGAKRNGWGAWYGAAKAGIGNRDGIGGTASSERSSGTSYSKPLSTGAAQMAGYPSDGGLGGLGGMRQEQEAGGLSGFFNSPETRDIIKAMGLSMMSSPRNNWLQDTGRYLPGIRDRRERREESAADRQATETALRSAGFTEEEAKQYSRNPQAANLALAAKDRQRTLAEEAQTQQSNRSYFDQLYGGGASTASPQMMEDPAASPTRVAQAGPSPALMQPGSLTDAIPQRAPVMQAPALQGDALQQSARPNLTLQVRDQLYAENDRLYQQAVRAENPQQRQAAELAIKANEAKIQRINDRVGEPPKIAERFNEETGQPEKVVFNPDTGGWEPFGGQKVPSNGISIGPDGSVQIGGPAKALTEAQSKDMVYSARAEGALPVLDQFDTSLASRTNVGLDAVPYGLGREMQSEDYQLAQQAGNEFLQAILRKDTGAAITEQEQVLYGETYLPKPGDGEALIAQKRQARRRALEAIKAGLPPSAIIAQELALRKSGSPSLGDGVAGNSPQPPGGGANRTSNGLSWSVN